MIHNSINISSLMRILFVGLSFAMFSVNASASSLVSKVEKTFSLQEDSLTNNTEVEETMASFPGGQSQFIAYYGKAFRYPVEAADLGIQGRVYISFAISENGKIEDVKAVAIDEIQAETEEDIVNLCLERYQHKADAAKRSPSKSELKKVKSAYNLLIKEAKRVVSKMPDWVPATQNGNPVRSKLKFPVTFRLS